MPYRIAVDTGGTFTDVVVAAPGGALTVGKAPSTPSRSADGVKAGSPMRRAPWASLSRC